MMEQQINRKKGFFERGGHLVAIQMALMALFVVIPAWPLPYDTQFREIVPPLQLSILLLFWSISLLFGLFGSKHLGRNLTPFPKPVDDNRLVQGGVYGLVRHPLYSAILLATSGWSIFTLSLSHILVTLTLFLFLRFKASKEEVWLTERHPEYSDYMQRTGMFFPSLRKILAGNKLNP